MFNVIHCSISINFCTELMVVKMGKTYASKKQGYKKSSNFLLSDMYIGNINTNLLKVIPLTLRITKDLTWISQDALDLGPSFQHLRLGGISSFVYWLLSSSSNQYNVCFHVNLTRNLISNNMTEWQKHEVKELQPKPLPLFLPLSFHVSWVK